MDDLVAAIRGRRMELGLSQLELDERAGLASGYVGKLEASLTNPTARNARSIGRKSMPLLLKALGLELVVVQGPAKDAENEKYFSALLAIRKKKLAENGALGARIKWARMTEPERKRYMNRMTRAAAEKRRSERRQKRRAERDRKKRDARTAAAPADPVR